MAPDLVAILLTGKWEAAVPVLQVICIANIVRLSGMLLPVILEARGRARDVLRFQIVSALFMPIGFAVGSRWGLTGVTAVWLLVAIRSSMLAASPRHARAQHAHS